jgi:hypothetical protein
MPNSSSLAIPFAGRSTADDVLSGVVLAGKTILITGCNSGFGLKRCGRYRSTAPT